jgi:hypothetical protein
MAYTDKTITTPFNRGEEHPNGYDFVTADELLKKIVDTSVGRLYIDETGYIVYESRHHREA